MKVAQNLAQRTNTLVCPYGLSLLARIFFWWLQHSSNNFTHRLESEIFVALQPHFLWHRKKCPIMVRTYVRTSFTQLPAQEFGDRICLSTRRSRAVKFRVLGRENGR